MSTELTKSTFSSSEAEIYQSISRAAVASMILGVVGLVAFAFVPLLLLAIVGLLFAFLSLRSFRRFPDELQGRPVAYLGGALCLFTMTLAPTYHVYVYMTEVPDGYTRFSFSLLKSDDDRPTQAAIDMNGEDVFMTGYIHPSSMDSVLSKNFVLVPDLGTCCFGGQPPLTHMIEVSVTGDQYARKTYRRQRVAGTLRVNSSLKKIDGLTGVYYQIRADILK